MDNSTFSEPRYWPYRIFIFGAKGRPDAILMKAFTSGYERDRAAKELKLENGQTAIAVTVDYLIGGGDEPKR
jgi:hypothetical protein